MITIKIKRSKAVEKISYHSSFHENKATGSGVRKWIALLLVLVLGLLPCQSVIGATTSTVSYFSDVPKTHYAFASIHLLRELKITDGIGNNLYGMGKPIKRSEFLTFLVRLMQWKLETPIKGSFQDNQNKKQYYYSYVETAVSHGVILKDTSLFRPDAYITREEMAVMIVRTLGFDNLGKAFEKLSPPLPDVTKNIGYITVASDFGIIQGRTDKTGRKYFAPNATALREEAAEMMIRMYNRITKPISELHGFYAISSASQMNLIPSFDSVSFGWSRLQYDPAQNQVILNTTASNGNEYSVPSGFQKPVQMARDAHIPVQLNVLADQTNKVTLPDGSQVGLLEYVFSNPEIQTQVIENILQQLRSTQRDNQEVTFDGVVVDFEALRKPQKQSFNAFLQELSTRLKAEGKKLYVAVNPPRLDGQSYFDGYDFKTIGQLADKVILMAHDYEAKKLTQSDMDRGYTYTPLTPIARIYEALKAITDKTTGIQDTSKIWLQISFATAQWEVLNGKVLNSIPDRPTYDAVYKRLLNQDGMKELVRGFDPVSANPKITYLNPQDNTRQTIWYEDWRSVSAKLDLARMFGVTGISLWRLGNIPNYPEQTDSPLYMNVWQKLLELGRN